MLRCTERDKKLIAKCALCRWLTTSQIQRLYFADATPNAVQKRLRKLAEEGYLRTHRETITSETLHAVGPKGKAIAEAGGLECAGTNEVPRQAAHLIGINDVRIAVEMGTIPVAFFFASWEFASSGWRHPIIPDAVFAVRTPALRRFAVEFDRATEGLAVLATKLRQYGEGLPGFPLGAVLIVTEKERRLDSLKPEAGSSRIQKLVGTLCELQSASIDGCSFVELGTGERGRLLDFAGSSKD